MHGTTWSRSQLRLAGIFLVLVLLPSFLLGYFSLRAVESERTARLGRIRENSERYADVAAQALHQQLTQLESAWLDVVPDAGWRAAPEAVAAALDTSMLAPRYVQAAYLLRLTGEVDLAGSPPPLSSRLQLTPVPSAAEATRFRAAVASAEASEYEQRDLEAARQAYAQLVQEVRNPQLRAIAWTEQARLGLLAHDWDAALAACQAVRTEATESVDLDNQPLAIVATLYAARAHAARGESARAAGLLAALRADLQSRSGALGASQYASFLARADSESADLEQQLPDSLQRVLAAARRTSGGSAKRPVDDRFFIRKLQRKLVRATMDEQPFARRLLYLSESAEGEPYLLAYAYLPDSSGVRIGGLFGLRVDLERVSSALLPRFLQDLELSPDAWLEVVDDAGQRVIGQAPAGREEARVASSLAPPFDFWSVVVRARGSEQALAALKFRTRVFLSLIAVLLVTILAGAYLVFAGLRREAQLAALKTSFVSNVSHELRTPLTSIRMYAEMLEMSGGRMSETERQAQLAVIRSECGRLERLIDAVLDFASLSRGNRQFHFEYEEVGTLVQTAAEEFREQATAAGFHYTIDVQTDLPEVWLDADAIRQVLFNLLSNAVKYSEDERWIAVRARREGEEIAIAVEDHGIGIAARDQERVFEDFYRVDQRLVSPRRGVGLGLTVVRRIIAAHQGRVTLASTPGKGSRFTVYLPVDAAAIGSPARGPQPTEVSPR